MYSMEPAINIVAEHVNNYMLKVNVYDNEIIKV